LSTCSSKVKLADVRATIHSLTDVDEAEAVLRENFYALDVEVLRWPESWTATFAVAGDPVITLGVRIDVGELGAYHVAMPLTSGFTWHQGNGEVRRATTAGAAVLRPVGHALVDQWDGDCRLLAVKIASRELENQLARMLEIPVRGPLDLGPVLDTTTGPGATWANLIRLIAEDVRTPGGLTAHPVVGARLQESLLTGLLLATAPGAVRRVVEAMRAQPSRPFTVAGLADIAGVGVRSLQQSFQRYVGMPPMAYLRQLRLGLVHDDLRRAPPGTTVAQVAYRYGFTHAGRFAAAYRTRYGELPIDTLRR
jgi:AraC-like DNA-binding protein